jgi:riboflavin kinase
LIPLSKLKSSHIETLKHLALSGNVYEYNSLSSTELGRKLGLSQQSASKKILELLEMELITRKMGARKQLVKLTSKGLEVLRREYSEYQKIFDSMEQVIIRGTLISGLGEGQYYISQEEYMDQFQEKLWFKPYPGTLNLRIEGNELSKLQILKDFEGILVEGFESEGRTFGKVKCFLTKIQNVECAVIIPIRTHYSDVLEIISRHFLRDALKLKDGDIVEIVVSL